MGGAEQAVYMYMSKGRVMGRDMKGANAYLVSETEESGHWVYWTVGLSSLPGFNHVSVTQILLGMMVVQNPAELISRVWRTLRIVEV